MMKARRTTPEQLREECIRNWGKNPLDWKFICPRCHTIQSGRDLVNAGVKDNDVRKYAAFSCIGRFSDDVGCDWSLGGLFRIHELEVEYKDGKIIPYFEIAQNTEEEEEEE